MYLRKQKDECMSTMGGVPTSERARCLCPPATHSPLLTPRGVPWGEKVDRRDARLWEGCQ